MKRILSATDFSPASLNALDYSLEIARILKFPVTIVHSIFRQMPAPVITEFYPEQLAEEQMEITENKLLALKSEAEKKVAGEFEIEILTKTGLPTFEIEKAAEETNAGLIVLGTKGDDFVSYLFGNTATDFVGSTERPILLVPEGFRFTGIRRVLFTTDLKENAFQVLGDVLNFLKPFDAEIEILHIDTSRLESDQIIFRKYCNLVKETFPGIRFIFRSVQLKHLAEVIELISGVDNADLIVLTRHHRNYWYRLLHHSVISEEIRKSHFPLLICHN